MRNRTRNGFTLIELLVVIAIIAILAAILFPVFAQAREKARAATCLSNLKQVGLGAVMYAQDYDETYPGSWQWSPCAIQAHSPYILPAPITMAQAEQQCQICPYVKNAQVFSCPSRNNPCSYGYAYPTMWGATTPIPGSAYTWPQGATLGSFTAPADTVMMTDSGIYAGTDACNALTIQGIESLCGARTGYSYPYVYKPTTNQWSAPMPLHSGMTTVAFVDGHVKAQRVGSLISPVDMFNRSR